MISPYILRAIFMKDAIYRQKAFSKLKQICECCGHKDTVIVHHID